MEKKSFFLSLGWVDAPALFAIIEEIGEMLLLTILSHQFVPGKKNSTTESKLHMGKRIIDGKSLCCLIYIYIHHILI